MKNDEVSESRAKEQVKFMAELIKRVSQPMIITSVDRHLLCWNEAFTKLTGYRSKELSDPIIDAGITAPEWHDSEAKALEKLQRTGKSQTFQKEYIRKDGSRVPVEVLIYKLSEDDSNAQYYIGLISDITERKHLEEELQKSESHYRTLVESAIEGIVVIQDGAIKFANPVVAIGTGYSAAELQSMSLKELLCPGNEKATIESISKPVAPGTLLVVPQVKIGTKTGDVRLIESTITSIVWDDKPANLNLLRDITEQKRLEAYLEKERKESKTIIDSAPIIVFYKDEKGRFVRVNKAFADALNMSQEEFLGKTVFDLYSTEIARSMTKDDREVLKSGRPKLNIVEQYESASGIRWVRTDKVPIFEKDGMPIGLVGFAQDITEQKQMEESLKQSEERYRTILDDMQNAYFEVDLAGNYTFGNESLYRYLGYSPDELQGASNRKVIPADDAEMLAQKFNQIYRTKTPINNIVHKLIKKDGSTGLVEIAASPLRNEKGEIIGFRGVGRDITNRIQMEESLKKSEEKYRSILEQMEEAYYEVDLSGNYTLFNDAMCHQLGYAREELMGLNYKAYVAPEDIIKAWQAFNQVYRTGKPLQAFLEKTIRKDGSSLIFETSVSPIRNEEGEITGFKGVGRDVTQRIQMEEALRQSEEKYRTILEDMEETYYENDLAGNFTFFNNACCRQLGYSKEELNGMSYKVYTHPEDVSKLFQIYNQLYRTGQSARLFTVREIKKDGTQIVAEISAMPLRNETGEITGFRGVSRDVTARLQMEEALKRSEEKYKSVLEHMEEAYSEVDLAGNFTFFNNALLGHLGYSKEELLGMNYKVYTAPENVEKVFQAYNQVYRTGQPIKIFAIEETRKDGTHMVAEISVSPLRDDSGKITGFRQVSRDMTERVQMEEDLRRSEERYRTMMDEMHDDYFEVDLAGNYTFVNDALCRSAGYTREEIIGKGYGLTYPDDAAAKLIYKAFNQMYRTGKPVKNLTQSFIRKDGSTGTSELSAFPMRNEKGEITGFRGVSHDITERKLMEEALRRSEERYRTVMDEMEEGYYETDLAGNYTFFNDVICKKLGYSREELMGLNYQVHTQPEDVKKISEFYSEVYRTGKPLKWFSPAQIRKDGTRLFAEDSVSLLRNESGEIIGFRGVSRDVTQRMMMENALRRSEERYRTVLEDMEEAYYELDISGNYTFFNDALCRMLGYSREELMGMNYKVYVPSEDVDRVFRAFNQMYRTGEPLTGFPMERIRKDKSRIFTETTGLPLRDENGEIIGFRGVIRDITERKQAQEEYRTIIRTAMDGFWLTDSQGRFLDVNEAYCKLIGYSRDELLDMSISDIEAAEKPEDVVKRIHKIKEVGYDVFETVHRSKDGTIIDVEVRVNYLPIRDGRLFVAIRDITQRKQAEEERKQLELKAQLASRLASVGELASGVAHEINNPLTGVIGYAHLLLARKDISRDARHDLEIINEGAQRVAGIVKKLLVFARQAKPEQRYVNINELIRNTLELRAYELSANNIKVALQLTRDMPMTIADPGQLQQVFLNLIINAETEMKQAHDKGRLTIKTEKMNGTMRITFKDTGPGIPKENLETIFDPFFTTREVGQGTGLGLSVCHGIITAHNGRIWAESEPGKGASFVIELPLVTEETQVESTEAMFEEPVKVAKAKILVVDDEPVIRQLISKVLGEQGHTVETVDNAAAALKMVKSKRYRLILLDIKMPGMSGVELYKQFQKIAPSLTKRVVFITGDVMGKRTISFLNKTKVPYMMKPFDAKELRAEINRILAKK